MTFVGMDVAQAQAFLEQVKSSAGRLRGVRDELTGLLAGSTWEGPDAHDFRSLWSGRLSVLLTECGSSLDAHAATLQRQIGEQQDASNDSSGSAGGPGGAAGGPGLLGGGALGGGAGAVIGARDEVPSGGTGGGSFAEKWTKDGLGGGGSSTSFDLGNFKIDPDGSVSYTDSTESKHKFKVPGFGSITATGEHGVELTGAVANDDGTITITGRAELFTKGGVDVNGKYGTGFEASGGGNAFTEFEITLPPGIDPSKIDIHSLTPFSAFELPPGTRITIDGGIEKFHDSELSAFFLKSGGGYAEGDFHRTMVEVGDGGRLRVMVGDGKTMDLSGYVGVGTDVFGATTGWKSDYEWGNYGTFTFDPSSSEGMSAFGSYIFGGDLPKDGTTGVSDIAMVKTFEYGAGGESTYTVGSGSMTHGNTDMTGFETIVTHPDGSIEQVYTQQHTDGASVTYRDSGSGSLTGQNGTFTYTLNKVDANTASMLNGFYGTNIAEGANVSIQVSSADMQRMMQADTNFHGSDVGHYATQFVSGTGGDETAMLAAMGMANGGTDSSTGQIGPGAITVH